MQRHKVRKSVQVEVDGLVFHLSPLTFEQKADAMATAGALRAPDIEESVKYKKMFQMQGDILKSALKKIDGLYNEDDTPYSLEFDSENRLTDKSLDDVMNLEIPMEAVFEACGKLIQPSTAQDGVEIEQSKGKLKK